MDEEISAKVIDWLDRNDPEKTKKPFFCWYNPARMHVTTVLSPKYEAMLGVRGGKDWGANEAGIVGGYQKTAMSIGGALAAPMTAFQYDWNMLPVGQGIALRHLESFIEFPPMQAPPSYNLAQVMEEINARKRAIHNSGHPATEEPGNRV